MSKKKPVRFAHASAKRNYVSPEEARELDLAASGVHTPSTAKKVVAATETFSSAHPPSPQVRPSAEALEGMLSGDGLHHRSALAEFDAAQRKLAVETVENSGNPNALNHDLGATASAVAQHAGQPLNLSDLAAQLMVTRR